MGSLWCLFVLNLIAICQGQGHLNSTIATKCRRELKTQDRALVELCDVVRSFLHCNMFESFGRQISKEEEKEFEERIKEQEGGIPCKFNLLDISLEKWLQSNVTGPFILSKESECREVLGKITGSNVCPVVNSYWTCVIQNAFARKPRTAEIYLSEQIFSHELNRQGLQIPCTFNLSILSAIADDVWSAKHIATLTQALFNAKNETYCRSQFWDDLKDQPMNSTCDHMTTYIKCSLAAGFARRPSQEAQNAFEEVYLPAYERRGGGELLCQYDLKTLSEQAISGARGQSSTAYLCTGHVVLFIWAVLA